MAFTIILCIMFPLVTMFNSYCLGKVFSVYFKRYRTIEGQSFAIGFMLYVFVCLASVFLFVFIPIQYQVLIYLLIAVQGLLVFAYAWHWRAVFSFVWPGWKAALLLFALIAFFYGCVILFEATPSQSQSVPVISSDSVQTDSGSSIYRFQTWQKFLNCWVLITGGNYFTFVAYSVVFVLVVPSAAVVQRLVMNANTLRAKWAALLLLCAALACGMWRFSLSDFSAWMVPAALLMFLEIRDYFARYTGRSTMTVVTLTAIAGMSMSRTFFYISLCVIWGLVFAMGMKKDNTVGSHFYRTASGSSLMLSMYLFDQSIPAAATLFFAGSVATLAHILLISGGRDRHVLFIARFLTNRARLLLIALGVLATTIGLVLALVNGFNNLDYGIYGPKYVLARTIPGFSYEAYWPVFGFVYGAVWIYCLFALLYNRTLRTGVWAFGALVLANPLLLTMLASLAGESGLELAFFVPTLLLLSCVYEWCVGRNDWSGLISAAAIAGVAFGLLAYQSYGELLTLDWSYRNKKVAATNL